MTHLEDFSLKEEYDQDFEVKKPTPSSSEYQRALIRYKEEEYSQESDNMILQISQDPKIPSKIRQKQPFYKLLVHLSKTLLLNEYEIVGFATQMDSVNWNFKQDLKLSDKMIKNLNLGANTKIDGETKVLFMYLILMGYFIKEGLNDKDELRKITAHCEEVYTNFKADYKGWQKKYAPRLDVIGINKKWKYFRNPTSVEPQQQEPVEETDKNYNHIVNDIVQLTGYHSSKNDFDVLLELGRTMHEAQHKPTPTQTTAAATNNSAPDDEGPRTLPLGFSMAPLENRYKNSRPESAFVCSRETSKDLFGNDKKVIFVSYSNTPEPTGNLIPAWRSLTPAELEDLFERTAPNKKIKKTTSINEQPNEEESKVVEKKNSVFRFYTPMMEIDQSLFEREPSFLGDGSGVGRLFSKGFS